LTGWSISSAHELRQLGAGVDAQLGERIWVHPEFVEGAPAEEVEHRPAGLGARVWRRRTLAPPPTSSAQSSATGEVGSPDEDDRQRGAQALDQLAERLRTAQADGR
jgi:hypothetical protein